MKLDDRTLNWLYLLCFSLIIALFIYNLVIAPTARADYIGDVNVQNFPETVEVQKVQVTNPVDSIEVQVTNLGEVVNLNDAVDSVAGSVFIILATIMGLFPIMEMFRKILIFCCEAFETSAIRQCEGGGLWTKVLKDESTEVFREPMKTNDGIKWFDKFLRR